jgi:hypothetical protein
MSRQHTGQRPSPTGRGGVQKMSSISKGKMRKSIIKSVKKATTPVQHPPKEKHIQSILSFTYKKFGPEELHKALLNQLQKKNWTVVLKALVVCHRCFADGDPEFMRKLVGKSSEFFSLEMFRTTAPTKHMLTVFISKYAKYLEEKVNVVRVLEYQFEKERSAVNHLTPTTFLDIIPRIQSQLNALCNCKLRVRVTNYPVLTFAYRTLIKDSFILFTMLTDGLHDIEEKILKYQKKEAAKCVAIYKLYLKEATALENIYHGAKSMFNDLPSIKKADSDILQGLEEYANTLGDTVETFSDDDMDELGALDPTNPNDDVLNTISNFGVYEDEETGSTSDSGSSGSENNAVEQEDFMSLILGMGSSSAFNVPSTSNYPFGSPHSSGSSSSGNPFSPSHNGRQNPFGGYEEKPKSNSGSNPFGITFEDESTINNQQPFGGSPFGGTPQQQNTGGFPFGGVPRSNSNSYDPNDQKSNPFHITFDVPRSNSVGNYAFGGSNPFGGNPNPAPNPHVQKPSSVGMHSETHKPKANPFGITFDDDGDSHSPFASPSQRDPFGIDSPAPHRDPFGTGNTHTGGSHGNTSQQFPFGGGNQGSHGNTHTGSPFGGGNGGNTQQNPFGNSSSSSSSQNPFGGGSHGSIGNSLSSSSQNPFGGSPSQQQNPFGGGNQGGSHGNSLSSSSSSQNPFGGSHGGSIGTSSQNQNPFGSTGSNTTTQNPFIF